MPEVEDTPENFKICMQQYCSICPSHPNGRREGLYCARGPSSSEIKKKGCNCPECSLWIGNGLTGMYYCT